jgi:putative addiction module component (TIGR02574 family)
VGLVPVQYDLIERFAEDRPVANTVTSILDEALRLSPTERGELAARLLDSLDPEADADVEEAWAKEIATRLEDYRAGRVKPIPGPESLRQIFSTDDIDGV